MGYADSRYFFNDPNRPRSNSSSGTLYVPPTPAPTSPPPAPSVPAGPSQSRFNFLQMFHGGSSGSNGTPIGAPPRTPAPAPRTPSTPPGMTPPQLPALRPAAPPSSSTAGGPATIQRPPAPSMPAAPGLPTRAAATPLPTGIDRSGTGRAIDSLGRSVNIQAGPQAALGEAAPDNDWERMARERFGEGFDPGAGQFVGSELSDTVFTPAQVNQMAQQRAAPTIRALQDESRILEEAARMGGGKITPQAIAALKAKAAIEGAGAISAGTRDAQLEAATMNAAQAARAAENKRSNFTTDLGARNTLGRLNLDEAGALLDAGGKRRSTDQERDVARYRGEIDQRGQNIDADVAEGRINTDRSTAAVRARLENDAAQMAEKFGISDRAEQRRTNDMGFDLDRARLGNDQWKTSGDWQQQNAERESRLSALDAQLADANLDRGTRATLERERNDLQRELENAQRTEAARQFDANLGLDRERLDEMRRQFGQQFGLSEREFSEGTRRFDTGLEFQREQGRLERDARRGPITTGGATYTNGPGNFGFSDPYRGGDSRQTIQNGDPRAMRLALQAIERATGLKLSDALSGLAGSN